jgi:hypothetical protein
LATSVPELMFVRMSAPLSVMTVSPNLAQVRLQAQVRQPEPADRFIEIAPRSR